MIGSWLTVRPDATRVASVSPYSAWLAANGCDHGHALSGFIRIERNRLHRAPLIAIHRRSNSRACAIGDGAHRVRRQMRVPFCRSGLLVPENLADHEHCRAVRD